MMKKLFSKNLLFVIFVLLGISSGVGAQQSVVLQPSIAFLGYYDNFGMLRESIGYSNLCKLYPQLSSINRFAVETGGSETYLLIPGNSSSSVSINEYTFEMFLSGDESEAQVLYRSEDGLPILLHCNNSDALSDVHVIITSNDNVIDFHPSIQINNGMINTVGAIEDISPAYSYPLLQEQVDISSVMPQYKGIKAQIKNGRISLYFDQLAINEWLSQGVCGLNGWVDLKGLNGLAKYFVVADLGKGGNPTIAILMYDGTVKMFNILESLQSTPDNLYLSAPLDGMTEIDSLSICPNNEQKNVHGAIFAFDKYGIQYQLRTFEPYGSIDAYLNNTQAIEVVVALNPSGNIQIQVYDLQGGMTLRQGTYSITLESKERDFAEYRVIYHCTRLLKGNDYIYDVQDGEFDLKVGSDNKAVIIPRIGNTLGVGYGKSIISRLIK